MKNLSAAFFLTGLPDAGDNAPYLQKEISHVLVRLLLQRDVKTISTTPSTRLLRTISTRRNVLSLKFLQKEHMPLFPSLTIHTKHSGQQGAGRALIPEQPKC